MEIANGTLLKSLPTSIGDLSYLTSLDICFCCKLKCLPDSLGHLNLLRNLSIEFSGVKSLPKSLRQLINLQTLSIGQCPISELDLGGGLFPCLERIYLGSTKVSKISISEDCYPVLKSLSLCDNSHLKDIEVLPNTLEHITLRGCPELDALPNFEKLAFVRGFELKGCCGVKKIQGLENCRSLETLTVHTRWEEAGIESLERMERLRIVHLTAMSRSGVESCIENTQKWPKEEVIVCTRAVLDAATLVRSFAFANLSVVDSFATRKFKSSPSLKWPSTACCILLCYVLNCESRKNSLWLAYSTKNTERITCMGGYDPIELEKGKWVCIALFTRHSRIQNLIPRHTQSRVHIGGVQGNEGDVENGLLVTGEEERVVEAFTHLWASLSKR